jgi:hypothetical protein
MKGTRVACATMITVVAGSDESFGADRQIRRKRHYRMHRELRHGPENEDLEHYSLRSARPHARAARKTIPESGFETKKAEAELDADLRPCLMPSLTQGSILGWTPVLTEI